MAHDDENNRPEWELQVPEGLEHGGRELVLIFGRQDSLPMVMDVIKGLKRPKLIGHDKTIVGARKIIAFATEQRLTERRATCPPK